MYKRVGIKNGNRVRIIAGVQIERVIFEHG